MRCLALRAKDVEVMSFFCPVRIRDSEQLPVAVVGQSGVCSVRSADELNDSRPGTRCRGSSVRQRQRRAEVDEADTHSVAHRRHSRLARHGKSELEGLWRATAGRRLRTVLERACLTAKTHGVSSANSKRARGSCGRARRQSSPRVQGSEDE
jgi:hypothetical protein